MARSVSIPAGNYQAGTYPSGTPGVSGGWSLDGITKDDTDWIEAKIPTTGLPAGTGTTILRVTVQWEDAGQPVSPPITGLFNGGPWLDRQGQPLAFLAMRVGVPKVPGGKRAVSGGRAWVEVLVPLTVPAGGSVAAGAG